MSNQLGKLVIELAANTAQLQSDMGKAVGIAQRGAASMKNAFESLAAGITGGLIGGFLIETVKESIKFGDEIQKAATKAGIGGHAMSELAYAAKLADVDLSSLSQGLKKMQVALSEAGTGAKIPNEALTALGLTLKDLEGLSADSQFAIIGDRISELKNPADRTRAAIELFGKSGADLLPLFSQGAAGIAKARAEAEKLGASLSDQQVKSLSEAADSVKKLDAAWHGFWTNMVARASDSGVTDWLNRLSGAIPLEQQLRDAKFNAENPNFFDSDKKRAAAQKLYADLKAKYELIGNLHPELGGRGRGGEAAPPPGYIDHSGDAAALADKTKQEKYYEDMVSSFNKDMSAQLDKDMKAGMEDQQRRLNEADDYQKRWKDSIKEVEEYRQQQAEKSAAAFKGLFLDAFDDMINTGKIHWRELLKYFIAEIARSQLSKILDDIFANLGSKGSGSGGGFWSTVVGWIAGAVGSGKAAGGPVSAGNLYPVGEHGPELFAPGVSGSIIPNNALGGSPNIVINNYVDASGNNDLEKALPRILDQSSRATEARLVERMRRGFYPQLAR